MAIDGGKLTRQFCRCTKERVADDGCIGAIAARGDPRSGVLVGDRMLAARSRCDKCGGVSALLSHAAAQKKEGTDVDRCNISSHFDFGSAHLDSGAAALNGAASRQSACAEARGQVRMLRLCRAMPVPRDVPRDSTPTGHTCQCQLWPWAACLITPNSDARKSALGIPLDASPCHSSLACPQPQPPAPKRLRVFSYRNPARSPGPSHNLPTSVVNTTSWAITSTLPRTEKRSKPQPQSWRSFR